MLPEKWFNEFPRMTAVFLVTLTVSVLLALYSPRIFDRQDAVMQLAFAAAAIFSLIGAITNALWSLPIYRRSAKN